MERTFPALLDPRSLPAGRVLAVAPHPDDETIGCGGVLALHAARGDDVRVVIATDGDAGDRDGVYGGRMGAIRREEAARASRALGVAPPAFLGLPDGALCGREDLVARLEDEMRATAPAALYLPSFTEIHPDHLAVSTAGAEAARAAGFGGRLFFYEIGGALEPTGLVDITPHADTKRRALSCYASQAGYNDLITKTMERAGGRAINVDLASVRYVEAFLELAPHRYDEARRRYHALLDALGIDRGRDGAGA